MVNVFEVRKFVLWSGLLVAALALVAVAALSSHKLTAAFLLASTFRLVHELFPWDAPYPYHWNVCAIFQSCHSPSSRSSRYWKRMICKRNAKCGSAVYSV
jgi:hypothetical protein